MPTPDPITRLVERSRRRLAWALGLALASWSSAAGAREATPEPARLTVSLTYDVDARLEGCPTEDELRRGVTEQLGYDPFRAEARHHVVARVAASERSLDGRLEWTDDAGTREGERRLSSTNLDCVEFVRGLSFALAVQIQLSSQLLSPPAVVEAPPPRATPAPASVLARLVYALDLGPTLSFGGAPEASAGGRLVATGRIRAVSLELGAEADLPARRRQADGSGFDARTLAATLALCGHWRRLALGPLATLGQLRVVGFGVDDARAPTSFTAAVGLRAAFEQPLSTRFAVGVRADGSRTLTTRTVSLNELPVWTTPAVTFTLGIDLALLFR